MHEAGPNWRNRCYATHIDVVSASLVEMHNRQHLDRVETRRRRDTNLNAMAPNTQPLPESTSTSPSAEMQTPISTSLSIFTSPTYTGEYSPTNTTTSPESSFSATTPSSSSPDVTRCPSCPAVFKGSKRDRKSNLRRHTRTKAGHVNVVGLPCKVPGCNAILSRSDNLDKHMRQVHRQIRRQR